MAKGPVTGKRLQIDKANATIIALMAAAAFVATFSIFASRALLSTRSYQSNIIGMKEKAVKQLQDNIKTVASLESSYREFVDRDANILGGSSKGSGERDGDNARIILDALPSQYDFPALANSIEKIMTDNGFRVDSMQGSDDEVAQSQKPTGTPKPVQMPINFTGTGSYQAVEQLFSDLQNSIRPFSVQKINISGKESALTVAITAHTYYLPEKTLSIEMKEVK